MAAAAAFLFEHFAVAVQVGRDGQPGESAA
jgi:hypothetical protein